MLELEKIEAKYGHIRALKGISIEVRKKEIVTLIGANGAGKTTTLSAILGIVKIHRGRIRFNDQDITRTPSARIVATGISMAPEGRRIFPRLTVLENLEMGDYALKDRVAVNDNLERMFALFPLLLERKTQLGGTLSGGEQQMLAIARAMMDNPKVLLLDEPSLGLAPKLVKSIFNTIRDINSEGVTILLVEQNAKAALSLAHRGYVLETGTVMLQGTGLELSDNEAVKEAYLGG